MKRAVIRRKGIVLEVSRDGVEPLPMKAYKRFIGAMQYSHVTHLYGQDIIVSRDPDNGKKTVTRVLTEAKRLYRFDDAGRLVCGAGYIDRVYDSLRKAGYEVGFVDLTPFKPAARTPDWKRLEEYPIFRAGPGDAEELDRLLATGEIPPVGLSRRVKQEEVARVFDRRLSKGLGGIVQVPPGFGKAQPLDSTIQTPRGPKRMGDIRIGDQICAPAGTTEVIAVHPQGEKDVYRVTFRDGDSVECCIDHLWEVSSPSRDWKTSRVVDTRYLLEHHLTPSGEANFEIRLPKPLTMRRSAIASDVAIPHYTLGVLLGDGCFRGAGLTFTSGDPEIADNVRAELREHLGVVASKHGKYSIGATTAVGWHSNRYKVELQRVKLWGLYSTEKFIPKEYLYCNTQKRWELLRGLMDTDGEVTPRGALVYSTSSPHLRDDVKWLVESLGGICRWKPKPTKCELNYRLYIRLPSTKLAVRLARKQQLTKIRVKYWPKRIITKVELVGRKACQCITVSNPDGLYLTDHCVITHNSFSFAAIAMRYRKAKIAFVVPGKDNFHKTVRHLTRYVACVDMVGCGKKASGRGRVTVYTPGSVHYIPDDTELIVFDETHVGMAKGVSEAFSSVAPNAVRFGYTATPTGRMDGADAKMEGMFGPVIYEMSWPEATALGMIVPIDVRWISGDFPDNPAAGRTGIFRKKHGIWQNESRNKAFARQARKHEDDQVLIMVNSIEHAIRFKQLLPEFELVYGAHDVDYFDKFVKAELIDETFVPVTDESRERMRRRFEKGKLRKVIATDVWSTGVSFDSLQVLFRADARSSSILDEQIPGRVSRVHDASGKRVGILYDCDDAFDKGFESAAARRRANYREKGWRQIRVGSQSTLAQ